MSPHTVYALLHRLIVPAGKASPSPPVGPALGARGVKSIDFCKEFNARTAHLEPLTPTPVVITVNPDRSFTFVVKSPPTGWLLKQASGIDKGAGETPAGKYVSAGKEVGQVSIKHVYEIAKIKQKDAHLAGVGLEALARSVIGTCKSMGEHKTISLDSELNCL